MKIPKNFNRYLIGYGIAFLLPLVIFSALNDFEVPLISFPLKYAGDYLEFISLVKAMIPDSGGAINAPVEGVSYSLTNIYSYNFFAFFVYLVHFLTSDPVAITNIYYIFTFSLTSISFVFLSRYFSIPFSIAIPISILYSFIPFHYMRNTGHLMEMSYYFVPLQVLIIFWFWSRNTPFFSKTSYSISLWGKKDIFIYLVILLLLPTSAYYMFMFFFLTSIAAISSSINNRCNIKPILGILFLSVLIAVSLYKTRLIDVVYQEYNPEYKSAVESVNKPLLGYIPGDVEKYALKVTHMLLPVDKHRIDFLKNIKEEYNKHHTPINENRDSSLGIVGSLAFLALLFRILLVNKRRFDLSTKLSILVIFSVLLATYGGISSFIHTISTLIFSQEFPLVQARAYNRIIVFIACFCFLYIALTMKSFFYRYKMPVSILALILMLFGLFDQTTEEANFNSMARVYMRKYLEYKDFFKEIDNQAQAGSRVFMLPFIVRHNNFSGWKIWYNEPLRAYIHSDKIAWSYGGHIGSSQVNWYGQVANYPAKKLIQEISNLNFFGILVDKNGYSLDEAEKLHKELVDAGAYQLLQSADNRYEYYSIVDFAKANLPAVAATTDAVHHTTYIPTEGGSIEFSSLDYPDFLKSVSGISAYEPWGRWSDGEIVEFQFKQALPTRFVLRLTAQAFGPNIGAPVTVRIGAVEKNLQLTADLQEYQLTFEIASPVDRIEFLIPHPISPAELGQSDDVRRLGIGFVKLQIKTDSQ
jgi:phosphoglycerol transferase